MQEQKELKSNVIKSLLKGTIAIAILTPFLQINPSTYLDYGIFLVITYGMIGAYMFFKRSTVYILDDTGIRIQRFLRKEIIVPYTNVSELSIAQGILAKRFKCGSIYLDLKKGSGTHRSLGGTGAVVLKDIPLPIEVYREISNYLGPFAPTV